MSVVLRSVQRANSNLDRVFLRSSLSMQDTNTRTSLIVSCSLGQVHGHQNSSIVKTYSSITQESYRRHYSTQKELPNDNKTGEGPTGGLIKNNANTTITQTATTSSPFTFITQTGIKIGGIGVALAIFAGLGGYLYCETATDHELCNTMRDKLGLKKN